MSRPVRVRMMLVLAFALTLTAGVVAGVGLARQNPVVGQTTPPPAVVTPTQPATTPAPNGRDDWLAKELGLTAQQNEQLKAIRQVLPHDQVRKVEEQRRAAWKERDEKLNKVTASLTTEQKTERDRIRTDYDGRIGELAREKDEALAAVYTPDQKAARESAFKDYTAKVAELNKERDALYKPMLDKTRLVLNEEQNKRFDALMRGDRGRPGGGGDWNHRGGRPGTQPTTRPGGPDGNFRRGPGFGDGPPQGRPDESNR